MPEDKIQFLIKSGYCREVIERCSLAMQEDMYYNNYKEKFGSYPGGAKKRKLKLY